MKLPEEFTVKMRVLLKEEYPAFLASYDDERTSALRVNERKITPQAFEKIAPFPVSALPFIRGGYRVGREFSPARHPYYAAGLYYLQEPSAMTPVSVMDVAPGEKVLDLCAAPGGKATALAARLGGKGLLVANEVSASRAKALLRNLEVFGADNCFVTNAQPAVLASRFPLFFDHVLVDAPCSGEGMFRKEEAVMRAWSPEKNAQCAKVQRRIILDAADMLKEGGTLVYSTCTFDPGEDECVIAFLLRERPEMELISLPHREGFSEGFSEEFLVETGYLSQEEAAFFSSDGEDLFICNEEKDRLPLTACVRLWPHKCGGEGHFIAMLRKRGTGTADTQERSGQTGKTPQIRQADRREESRRQGRRTEGRRQDRGAEGRRADQEIRDRQRVLKLAAAAGITIPERIADRLEIRGGQAFASALPADAVRGIPFVRNGLYLGEIRGERFEPAQAFAMTLDAESCAALNFSPEDERVRRYLRGESLHPDDLKDFGDQKNGWRLVCVHGYPLGWGKISAGILKNKYHPGWRNANA